MWKDSIRNIVVIFQPSILRIVGFYVRHSANIETMLAAYLELMRKKIGFSKKATKIWINLPILLKSYSKIKAKQGFFITSV